MFECSEIDHGSGGSVAEFRIANRRGLRLKLLSHGARIAELWAPDRNGALADIALGFDDLESYDGDGSSFGATCGPVGNRISGAAFEIDGARFDLVANEGPNTRHGGPLGYSRRNWAVAETDAAAKSVLFELVAPDGDQGFPGPMTARTRYSLSDDNVLTIEMTAVTARPAVVNLIHHSYFNLAGHGAGDIRGHVLQIEADRYTPLTPDKLPTGAIDPVAGTPFDFTAPKPIGQDLAALEPLTGQSDGYDHNWALRGEAGALRRAAVLLDPGSGRRLTVETDQPGLQVYAGGAIKQGLRAKEGAVYGPYAGVALETQRFPNSINTPSFPSAVLRPGALYRHVMRIAFDAI